MVIACFIIAAMFGLVGLWLVLKKREWLATGFFILSALFGVLGVVDPKKITENE